MQVGGRCNNSATKPSFFQVLRQVIHERFDLRCQGRAILYASINIKWLDAGLARLVAVLEQRYELARIDMGRSHEFCQAGNAGAVDGHLGQSVDIVTDCAEVQRCVIVLALADKPPAQKAPVQRVAEGQAGMSLQVLRAARDAGPFQVRGGGAHHKRH